MKPPIEFLAIGVTGHRLNRLEEADWELLRARVREIFDLTLKVLKGGARRSKCQRRLVPKICVISPLAEGADQIVAEEGLAVGCELYCPLPFEQEKYEKDFSTAESVERFRILLARASFTDMLGGKSATKAERDASYASVGHEVLRQSDILLAVWDGNPAKGIGGTAQIVGEAGQAGIPVAWIHSQKPHQVKILSGEVRVKGGKDNDFVAEWVKRLTECVL